MSLKRCLTNMNNTKKREYAFDILRAVAMIMVITIHVSNVYSRSFGFIGNGSFIVSLVFNTVSRISVPIFLMISGALLLDREFNKKKYFKRLIKFILIIIVWDIIYLVWEYLYLGITYDKLYKLLYEPYRAHLWYLYTILLLYAIQPLLRLIMNKSNKVIKIILLLIWLTFSTLSIVNYYISLYFTVFSYIGFFILGKYLYDFAKSRDLKKYNIPLIILMIVCFAASIFLNYSMSMKRNTFYNFYFAYRVPFIMIPSFAFYVMVINNYTKDSLNKFIMKLSDLSFGVYLIHGIFLDVTVKMFVYQNINSLIGIPVFTFMIFVCSTLSVWVLKKIKGIRLLVT